jgi:EpsI family protein
MVARLMMVALCFAATSAVLVRATRVEPVAPRDSLAAFPLDLDEWQGRRGSDLDEAILAELGVDEYVNAIYRNPARDAVGLYIGYYASQRQGNAIHSPANCLPGGGWQPVSSGHLRIQAPSAEGESGSERTLEVTRWVIQKGDERQLVLDWYQNHGRVVASEYWNKIYLVTDAVRMNRTDGALVRVITPVMSTSAIGLDDAERTAVSFVRSMFPRLNRFLPA